MTKKNQVYKCLVCGNIVDVLHEAGGELVCCNQSMNLVAENTIEASQEKHIPVIEKVENGTLIKVGSIEHPMDQDHYIEWIEATNSKNQVIRLDLVPGDKPEMLIQSDLNILSARAYCNLHGLWSSL